MQHESAGPSPVFLLCERRAGLTSLEACGSQNFAETLPTEMSVRIFRELDAESLCRASRTCKLWRSIIDDSEQLWRQQCMLVRAVCRREVDSDRSDGLSWKVSLLLPWAQSPADVGSEPLLHQVYSIWVFIFITLCVWILVYIF